MLAKFWRPFGSSSTRPPTEIPQTAVSLFPPPSQLAFHATCKDPDALWILRRRFLFSTVVRFTPFPTRQSKTGEDPFKLTSVYTHTRPAGPHILARKPPSECVCVCLLLLLLSRSASVFFFVLCHGGLLQSARSWLWFGLWAWTTFLFFM